jgi:glycosyltransferase involved in cell wall biosynthesis
MLAESVGTLINQTIPPFEVLVVDDGSSDDTAAVVAGLPGPIRYVRQENAGKAAAVNRGLSEARGELIWLFDDDDWAEPDAIERRVAVLLLQPTLGFVGGGHCMGHADEQGGKCVDSRRRMPIHPPNLRRQRLFEDCYFSLCSVLARRECFDVIGGMDVSLKSSEDYDALIRMAARYDFDVIDEVIFTVRQHSGVRGAGEHAYAAAKRREVFRRSDRIVGSKMRRDFPLSLFEPDQRAAKQGVSAWLERAVAMSSKGLIAEAFEDLRLHIQARDEPLSALACQRVMDMLWCDYACDAILDDLPGYAMQVGALRASGPIGRQALWHLRLAAWRRARMRGLPWAERRPLLRVWWATLWGD